MWEWWGLVPVPELTVAWGLEAMNGCDGIRLFGLLLRIHGRWNELWNLVALNCFFDGGLTGRHCAPMVSGFIIDAYDFLFVSFASYLNIHFISTKNEAFAQPTVLQYSRAPNSCPTISSVRKKEISG